MIRNLFIIAALAGAVVAVVFFILANGQDTEWGLTAFGISWGLYLFELYMPTVTAIGTGRHTTTVKEE